MLDLDLESCGLVGKYLGKLGAYDRSLPGSLPICKPIATYRAIV